MIAKASAEALWLLQPPPSTRVAQTTEGLEIQNIGELKSENLIGYILPLDEKGSEHLLFFKNGQMMTTADQRLTSEPDEYGKNFNPNDTPLESLDKRPSRMWRTADQAANYLLTCPFVFGAEITNTNNHPDKIPVFGEYFKKAKEIAVKTKAERDLARRSTIKSFLAEFGSLFKEPKPDLTPPSNPNDL